MADQNITELPIKTNTGVASTDYMLGIDSAEGYQILVRDVAKYIVENYNGSTIAGSAQTLQSAVNSLKTATTQEQLRNIDLNTLTEPTRYYFAAGDNGCTNVPSGVNSFGLIVYRTAGGFRVQILISSGTGTYIRKYADNAWTNWELEPTRAEITALNSKIKEDLQLVSIAGNSSRAYTFPTGRFGFFVWSVGTSPSGLTFLYTTASGLQVVTIIATSTSNNPTFTHSDGMLTIQNNASVYIRGALVFSEL